ncbi:MAG: hypothetical protein M9964_05190 [Solirubrobacterales bacterium]|nr:hypothetical protein [Solirubrobacterales bacterium]
MEWRNTKGWLAAGGVLSGAALAVTGSLTALVDVNGLFRLLDILDVWPL